VDEAHRKLAALVDGWLSEAGQLKANRAMTTPFLHHETKSKILFQNERKDQVKCDFIGGWIVFEMEFADSVASRSSFPAQRQKRSLTCGQTHGKASRGD
jgi:hypothetical protein